MVVFPRGKSRTSFDRVFLWLVGNLNRSVPNEGNRESALYIAFQLRILYRTKRRRRLQDLVRLSLKRRSPKAWRAVDQSREIVESATRDYWQRSAGLGGEAEMRKSD